ncbi:B-cell CLL/lymphoma 9 protein isoform X1 [Latimeria chalumnae]|uniref:B-cell CLL/lymphoma 9 protein isoform X1 n=2 Tax=Latimeria chalumnae TaxID=7897 RepID=UPI0003C14C6B|nr:PREDICTED: B-cell CLL/lymphoma 9 protein [Latimeria chalumnae]|eukprot:XP_006012560.1 PREDICTED: B-cell CLL/lymphoma 9 protein [Latimeria chalumnae]
MLEAQEGRAQFNKKERVKKEKGELKDGGSSSSSSDKNDSPKRPKTLSPHKHFSNPSLSVAAASGSPSMHSSNPKVRNSPSANTQSSPKSKQEVMVRPPAVMSPSSGAQMDSKLSTQGKHASTTGQSQTSPCDTKNMSGNHASKTPQGPGGSLGLKNGQGLGAGNGAKGKVKRERSTSDSYEQRDGGTPTNESELKDSGSRTKRLCVAERRQPYSGADWCSGGESDEEEPAFFNCNSTDSVKPQDSQHAPHPLPSSNMGISRSSTPSHNSMGPQNAMAEAAGNQKTPPKVVYVFSTEMANTAAEAVRKGQADSIVAYHMQNISNKKTERSSLPTNNQAPALRSDPQPLQQQQQSSHHQEQSHPPSQKVQQSQPLQGQGANPAAPHGPASQDTSSMDSKTLPASSPQSSAPHSSSEGAVPNPTPNSRASPPGTQSSFPPATSSNNSTTTEPKNESKAPSQSLPGGGGGSGDLPNLGDNPEGLSQEQLEHRERSLQTLRDIQRMLFPDEKDFALKDAVGQSGGPQHNAAMLDGPPKKAEGPLQAMIAQSQSLGKPPPGLGPRPEAPPFGPPGHREIPFSPDDLGPPTLNSQPGQDHMDHMTPEQVAWLKLQQEFYEEKRRKQEQVVVQHRSMQDMIVPHGPRGMIRGPPPPYQVNPGENWGPGGPEPFGEALNMPNSMHPRGMAPHPGVPGNQLPRMPGFPGMINPDIDGPGVPNPMQRPGLPGANWPEEMTKMSDGRTFPPGQGVFSGPGRGERFPNPQNIPEEMFQQQMSEKQLGIQAGMAIENIRPGIDMNRMIPAQRHVEPGNGNMFPRLPAEGPMSPSRMEFSKGMPGQMGPGREVEFGMGPGGMNMKVDMNLNVNMNSNPQIMSQKMREGTVGPTMNLSPEDMIKMRSGNPDMMSSQPKMLPSQFVDSPQQDFLMGPRPFPNMRQGPGGPMRNAREQFGPEHRTNVGGNARLSHMPPLPLNPPNNQSNLNAVPPVQRSLGRKPMDVPVSTNQVNSPNMNPLKSPTLRQVQSPMLGSPSANLKSPQTPSQLAGMLSNQATAAAAASIKSPPVLSSAAASPVHLKSPSLPAPSPSWTSSPKPPLPSPGVPQNNKPSLSMTSPGMMGNVESGGAPPPPTGQSGSVNHPGSLPSSSPYTIPPEPTLSQNPLSIMMSRMSKFAMPSSTPLYHDAIKTVASSDDDSPPARSPNLPSMNMMPGMGGNHPLHSRIPVSNAGGQMANLSPMGMTQPLSHSLPNQMPSPNPMGPSVPPHSGPCGPGIMPHNPMMSRGPQDPPLSNPQMVPQGRMAFSQGQQGFPPVQSPPQQVPFSHNGPNGGQGNFPPGMGFPGEGGPLGRPSNIPVSSTDPVLCKPGLPGGPDSYNTMGSNMPSVFADPDLQEVIRPGASGIPEFDLSRIIPSEKPSQTLQYFPRGEAPGRKPSQSHGPGFPHMQGIIAEQNPRMRLALSHMGGPGPMGAQDLPMGNPASMTVHNPMRPPGFMQQGMMGPQHRMISPAQTGMMGNPAAVMMQSKERGPGGIYAHPGPVGSPNIMMSLQGMVGPQQSMMMPPQMRPRSMATDLGMAGFNQGPGNPGNMMF